jgi:hypothetical protein
MGEGGGEQRPFVERRQQRQRRDQGRRTQQGKLGIRRWQAALPAVFAANLPRRTLPVR